MAKAAGQKKGTRESVQTDGGGSEVKLRDARKLRDWRRWRRNTRRNGEVREGDLLHKSEAGEGENHANDVPLEDLQ